MLLFVIPKLLGVVLLLLLLNVTVVVVASSSTQQTTTADTTTRRITNAATSSSMMEMDISYTVQATSAAVVMKNTTTTTTTTTSTSKHEWIMMDHLSLVEASMKELIQQISKEGDDSTTGTRSGTDSINDRITTFSGTTNNIYGQVHSFQTSKECFGLTDQDKEESWLDSSYNHACLDVHARLFILLVNNDKKERFVSDMVNDMTKKVLEREVVVVDDVDVKMIHFLQDTTAFMKNQAVKMTIQLLSLQTSSTFHHHETQSEHEYDNDVVVAAVVLSSPSPHENSNNENSEDPIIYNTTTRRRRDLGNKDIISGDVVHEQIASEQHEKDYHNDDDEDDTTSTTNPSLDTTTTSTITPGTMAGLIVGLFAVIWLLLMICICSIYSTSKLNHKNAVETYFTSSHDRPQDDDVHPNLRHGELRGSSKCSSIREEDEEEEDDDVAEEISSLVASAAIVVGNDNDNDEPATAADMNHKQHRRKSSKKQQHVEQYLATTRHHVGGSSTKQENSNTAETSNGHPHNDSHTHGDTTTTTTTPWYAPPIQRQHWGDTQILPHINWGDIFFDLFYVGAAYNLGGFLISLADDGSPQIWPRGLMYYIGMFGSLMLIWNKKTIFDSKFTVVDTIHRYSDMIRVCFLALSIMHIETFEIMSNPIKANTFNFMFGLVLEQFVTLGIQLEVAMRGIGDGHACHIEARNTILIQQLPQLVVYLTALGISVYSHFLGPGSIYNVTNYHAVSTTSEEDSYNTDNYNTTTTDTSKEEEEEEYHGRFLGGGTSLGSDDRSTSYGATTTSDSSDTTMFTLTLKDAPYIILFCSYMAYQLILFLYTRFYLPSKKSLQRNIQSITTPVNVEFIIHRYGEWTMLMLGESVLSLLIVETVELRDYYIVAAAGLIMVILLQVLHFESEPSSSSAHTNDEGTHALVRNKMSSLGFYYSTHLHSFSLIALGASFKVMLQIVNYMYHSDPTLNSPESYHGHSNETKNDDESIYTNETLSNNSTYNNGTDNGISDEYDDGYEHLLDNEQNLTSAINGTPPPTNTSLSFFDVENEHEALLDGVSTEDNNEKHDDSENTATEQVAAGSKERKPQEHLRFLRHSSTTDGSDNHDDFDVIWKNNNNDVLLFGSSLSSFSTVTPLSPVPPPFMTEHDHDTTIFHHEHRSLAGGSKSTQGIDDSYEVKMVSANLFGISLMLVLISMECMSLSHRGVKQKRLQFRQQSWCTRVLIFIFTLLRVGLILAAGTVSVWIWEPKWLVSSGMIIVFLSVIVKSNGRDMMLRSSRLSSSSKRSLSSSKK